MVKDPITESAKTSSSTAADDTIPVESSPQMDMSSPLRATQHNGLSIHQDRVLTSELQRMHEFNIDRTNTFDPTFYEFSHNLLLYQLTKLENTASLLCPPPVHVHGGFDRQPSSDTLRYHQYDFGSGTPQLHSDEQHLLQAQQEAQQQINTGRNELPHHPYSNYASIRQSQFQIPVGENSIPQTNSTVSLNNLERDNSIPNTTAQASFYQANDTVSFYGDDTSDQIPHSVNESTTTFLNILDPSQSTDAINETIPGEFNVYNEYDVSNASTDSLPNFNRTPARARLYQHPSVNRDLSHLQFFDVVAQRRFQSVNYPPVNQVSHSLEAESYMTPHNLLTLVTQDTNMDHSLTPTFSDVSSFTSSASLHHPTATNSSSLGTFDPSVSIDSVPPAINKTPARTLNSPLASAMVGSSSTTNHRISKKPSLCRLKTTSRKNLNKISGAVASLETNAAITSTRSSPSTASMGLDPTKPDTSILQSQQHLQADTPTSIQSFPYLRSQSQPQPQPQPQLHTLRTFSNASPSSMAVASTGRPSVLATPTSASSGPKGANVFRQDLEATNATSMLSPGVPLLPAADLLQRQDLWKKNYSLGRGREAGRASVSKRKIQKKKSLKLINDSTVDDTTEVLDPKAKSINKRELASLRNNVMGFNPDFNTDNDDVSESDDIDDSFNSKIGKEKLQPSQSKPSKLRKSKSTPLLPSTTRDLLVNKDQPIMKKKYTRRRLLPRSKKGCWICRIKHLKCDEVRPSCGACIRFGLICDYNPDKPDYVTDKELRQKKLSEISVTRKQNQALEKRPSKRESTKRK